MICKTIQETLEERKELVILRIAALDKEKQTLNSELEALAKLTAIYKNAEYDSIEAERRVTENLIPKSDVPMQSDRNGMIITKPTQKLQEVPIIQKTETKSSTPRPRTIHYGKDREEKLLDLYGLIKKTSDAQFPNGVPTSNIINLAETIDIGRKTCFHYINDLVQDGYLKKVIYGHYKAI